MMECFPDGSVVKNRPASAGDAGSIPVLGRSPGEGDGTYSIILSWKISGMEEPGRLQLMGKSLPGSSVCGISQAKILERFAISYSR